jgi:molybdenum cofactor guanylyltransferase
MAISMMADPMRKRRCATRSSRSTTGLLAAAIFRYHVSRLHSNSTAFILAGGRSSRMGFDKAFLRLGRGTLLEHLIAKAKEVCETVALVGDKQRLRPYGWVIEDEFPGQGPLAGIQAALQSSSAQELNLFLAVDIPKVSTAFLKYLLKTASSSPACVTVPYSNGFPQPLCAVYRTEFGPVAEAALRAGHNKIDTLFKQVPIQRIEESELTELGFPPSIFDNVNTPEDWEQMQRSFGATHG